MDMLFSLLGIVVLLIGFFIALASRSSSAWVCYASGLLGVVLISGAYYIERLKGRLENK